jgi:hypothetical protein
MSVDEITQARTMPLPYLNAFIQEGMHCTPYPLTIALRMRPPVPSGLQRVSPGGGATIMGKYIRENVSPPTRFVSHE